MFSNDDDGPMHPLGMPGGPQLPITATISPYLDIDPSIFKQSEPQDTLPQVCFVVNVDDVDGYVIGEGLHKELIAITRESVSDRQNKDTNILRQWFLTLGRSVLVKCYPCPAICVNNFGGYRVQYIATEVKPYFVKPADIMGSFEAQEFLTFRFHGKVVEVRADGTCVVECTGILGLIDKIKIRAEMTRLCIESNFGYKGALPEGTVMKVCLSKGCPEAEFEWTAVEPELCGDNQGNPTKLANWQMSSVEKKVKARATFGRPITNEIKSFARPWYLCKHACNSKGREIINITLCSVVKNIGSVVRVSGWAYKIRQVSDSVLVFILEDGTGCVQCVAHKRKCEPLVQPVEKKGMLIEGTVVNIKDPRNKRFAPYPVELCCDSICFEK